MSAGDNLSGQFERMRFDGVFGGYKEGKRTKYATVPAVPEGHIRLWRSTNFKELSSGYWADQPVTGFGSNMLYMDLPPEEAKRHETYARGTYVIPREGRGKPMPGRVNVVKYEDEP